MDDMTEQPGPYPTLADVAAGAIRTLNYATRGDAGLNDPGDAYELLGALAQLAERLPQLCEQVRDYLTDAHRAGHLAEPPNGPHKGSTALAIMLTRDALGRASADATDLRDSLRLAQSEIRAVSYVGPDVDDDAATAGTE